MPIRLPTSVRLDRPCLERTDAFFARLVRVLRPAASEAAFAVQAFALKCDEHPFARVLLRKRTELWLYRSNQRAFCGDFVIVDMSSPMRSRRRALFVDLKQGAPLRAGGGGAGVQLRNAEQAARDLAHAGAIAEDAPFELLTGDARRVLAHLGA